MRVNIGSAPSSQAPPQSLPWPDVKQGRRDALTECYSAIVKLSDLAPERCPAAFVAVIMSV